MFLIYRIEFDETTEIPNLKTVAHFKEAAMVQEIYSAYRARRQRLGDMLKDDEVLFVPGAHPICRNADVDYPFRQDSNFFYCTGFNEPRALLIIVGGNKPRSILFCEPNNKEDEIWSGKRLGPKAAKRSLGVDRALSNIYKEKMSGVIAKIVRKRRTIYYPKNRTIGHWIRCALDKYLEENTTKEMPVFLDGDKLIGEMRLVKDESEVEQMSLAAQISADAFREILSLIHPGMSEVELDAEISYRFRRAGGDPCHAYPSIVAAGANACTLHHTPTDVRIKKNDLVLIDAGCEYRGYASDITRTFPANGKFTSEQRKIYEIVLAAQKAAISAAMPGQPLSHVHNVAKLSICEGLSWLGLIKKTHPFEAVKKELHKPFFPHGTSHWLGLDAHDSGDYVLRDGEKHRILRPGMVITVEPGIYIQPTMKHIAAKWRGIGVRIEDDVLITEKGNSILSSGAPKEVSEIEELMKKRKK